MRLEHVRRGSGEPLVLLHYTGASLRVWGPLLPRLAREHEVWAVDLPGFGRSLMLRDEEPTTEALARAVLAFMSEHGVDRFHVAGNSLGAGVALEIARAGAARSLCAISPIGFAEGRELWWLETGLIGTRRAAELALPHLDRLPLPAAVRRLAIMHVVFRGERMSPEDLAASLRDYALCPGFHPTLRQILAYRFDDPDPLECPVTIAWGEHDRLLLHRPQSARARERLPYATHVTLTGCGHLPMWDDPDQLAGVILEASTRS